MAKTKSEYKVVNKKPGKYHFPKFGIVDLRNFTDKEAERLLNLGFPYIEKVQTKKSDS